MRKKLCVGILRETREKEGRAPLTPADVNWLVKRGIKVEVESSSKRVFKDNTYAKSGAKVMDRFSRASLLLGIKEPQIDTLYEDKIYMLFSHTSKGQPHNMPLLKAFIKKNITLIDYEKIIDPHEKRLVYFGRFAGICGLIDSLHYVGEKLRWKGIENPFTYIKPAWKYRSLAEVKRAMCELDRRIQKKRLKKSITPFIIGITGHGNVSKGVHEVLDLLNPIEVHPKDMLKFIRHQKGVRNGIYKIVFLREEKIRPKDRKIFYFERYTRDPQKFESNLDKYLQYVNVLINGSYWDVQYPRMVTKDMILRLSKRKIFRLEFINDISCDINGSIELTHKATTSEDPVYTYDPQRNVFVEGYKAAGVTILAIDNLPSELPKDSSAQFGSLIRDYIYQIALNNATCITRKAFIPAEIRGAVITEKGKLAKNFRYLKRFL